MAVGAGTKMVLTGSPTSVSEKMGLKEDIESKIQKNTVVVFSKTFCPFCTKAKNALKAAGCQNLVTVELDERDDGEKIQDIMQKMTGSRSVPRVFINKKFIGGGDDVVALQKSGKLSTLLKE